MKLLLIHHVGMLLHLRGLFKAFAQSPDVELTVVVPEKYAIKHVSIPAGLCLEKPIQEDGYRMVPVPLRNIYSTKFGFQEKPLARVLLETRPHIIHVFDEPVSGFIPQVVWLNKKYFLSSKILSYGMENLPFRFNLRQRMKWKIIWRQMAGATASNNEALENLKAAGFPPYRPLVRIFRGTCLDIFRPMDRDKLKGLYKIEYPFVVGFVGQLIPEKGLTVLLAALRSLPSSVHCVLIGSGPLQAELELWSNLPDLQNRVHLLGPVPYEKMPEFMNCFDILAIPSITTGHWKEQFGKVIAEAMACGNPVIGSDSGAIPEVIGNAGIVCPERDPKALAEAIGLLYRDREKAETFSKKGLQRAQAEFSAQTCSKKHILLYQRILNP